MGASKSVSSREEEIRNDWMEVFSAMRLKKSEVLKLYDIYTKVDCDESGKIDVLELLSLLGIERTEFTERIFSAFDMDRTDKCDFYEFVVSVWKFCTLGTPAICMFAFDLYDTDADGILTQVQVLKLYQESFGTKAPDHDELRAALERLSRESNNDQTVNMEGFRVFCKTHKAMVVPVLAMQSQLKKTTLGTSAWKKISRRSVEVHKGFNVPLCDLMVLHSDRRLFHSLLDDRSVLSLDRIMRQVLESTDHAVREEERPVLHRSLSSKLYNTMKTINPLLGNRREGIMSRSSSKAGAIPNPMN